MKKLLVVLAILFIGILLAGCTSQPAAPAATPVPTVVATPVPTTVVTTAVPTPEPTKEVVVVVVKNVTTPTPTPTATPIPSYTITFTPDLTIMNGPNAVVTKGTKVIWLNNDPYKPHGVTFQDASVVAIPYKGTFEKVFNTPGTYVYDCVFQPEVRGTIFVN
jgi:plastocyanin